MRYPRRRRHNPAFPHQANLFILPIASVFCMVPNMDSDALNTFLAVYRRGGVSNAAKALHRSQPAISRRIALLEQELGVPLFERVEGRAMLSDAGRVLVPYAERAVAATQDAENAVRALAR